MATNDKIPRDEFSRLLRGLLDNPGAARAVSTLELTDFYGNTETWVIRTFRADRADTVFVERIDGSGAGLRLVLPPAVMTALHRQQDSVIGQQRRRGARAAVETKRAAGVDPAAALRRARARKGGR